MKKLYIVISAILLSGMALAQAPQKMSYQAVVRNTSNQLVTGSTVGMRVSILQGSSTGTVAYSETQNALTNANGLATIQIGGGTLLSGNFSTIDWSNGPYFIKSEVDPTGGSNYSIISTTQFLSVPYALYAETSGSSVPGPQGPQGIQGLTGAIGPQGPAGQAGADSQTLTLVGSSLSISGGNTVTLPSSSGNTLDQSYDQGGAGLGRSITTDAGSVQINNSGSNTTALEVNTAVSNSTAVLANITGVGVGLRAESTSASNTFAAIQGNTNSSTATNSAILGNNSGAGYGVAGQIPSTATGAAAVYGSNLRTSGGSGVSGIGFNGVVGTSQNAQGFGVYGYNNSAATGVSPSLGIGTYGYGFNGVYGQTSNVTTGWAGYFTADLGVDGSGYSVGGWFTASDRRLKSNIVPITGALEKLSLLQGTHYTITTPSQQIGGELQFKKREQYGVIAQDLQVVFPEMVSEKAIFNNSGDDTLYKTVDYIQLVPVMIEAIKELNTEVEKLKKELEDYKK